MPTEPKKSPIKEPTEQPAEHFPRKNEDPDLVERPDNGGQGGRRDRDDGNAERERN
jgi:hypothetical protein